LERGLIIMPDYTAITPQFLLSQRSNGYRNTASAISELVDNSLQAGAGNIDIILVSKAADSFQRVSKVIITDDGSGMNEALLTEAIKFGGGARHGSSTGLGKFGMGLPNSSVAQCRKFEVFTKENNLEIYRAYMDLDEMIENNNTNIKSAEEINIEDYRELELCNIEPKGTAVVWSNVDQAKPKTSKSLIGHIERNIGRKFKYYIKGHVDPDTNKNIKVNISIKLFEDNGNDFSQVGGNHKIRPFDSLFIMEGTQTEDIDAAKPFKGATSEVHSENVLAWDCSDGVKRSVKIICTKFRKNVRKSLGVRNPGSTDLGMKHHSSYLHRNYKSKSNPYAIVSLHRARRELTCKSFGFVKDVSNPTYRFMSIEVQFEADMDNILGVDSQKQGAHNFRNYLQAKDVNDADYGDIDDTDTIMIDISLHINSAIKEMKEILEEDAIEGGGGVSVNGVDIIPPIDPIPTAEDPPSEDEDISELKIETRKFLLEYYENEFKDKPELLEKNVDWFVNLKVRQFIIYQSLGSIDLYDYKTLPNNRTIIQVNIKHPFYQRYLKDMDDNREVMWFLFSSLVSAEKRYVNTDDESTISSFRGQLALKLKDLLEDWFK